MATRWTIKFDEIHGANDGAARWEDGVGRCLGNERVNVPVPVAMR